MTTAPGRQAAGPPPAGPQPDPVTFEVIWHRLLDITEEMGIKYMRTSGSPVLVGAYDIKISRAGFAAVILRNTAITLNTTSTANATLTVGDVATAVDVTDAATLIDTTTAQVGSALGLAVLATLSAGRYADLRQAGVELDTARTHALIEQVAERDASLGHALKTLATQLGYKHLLKLLKKGQTL